MTMPDEINIRYFQQPRRVGAWPFSTPQVATGWAGEPQQGEVLKLQIQVQDGTITDTRFKAFGPPWTIAAGAYLADVLVGKTLEGALALDDSYITTALAMPALQIRSAVLAIAACRAAVANFQDKSAVKTITE